MGREGKWPRKDSDEFWQADKHKEENIMLGDDDDDDDMMMLILKHGSEVGLQQTWLTPFPWIFFDSTSEKISRPRACKRKVKSSLAKSGPRSRGSQLRQFQISDVFQFPTFEFFQLFGSCPTSAAFQFFSFCQLSKFFFWVASFQFSINVTFNNFILNYVTGLEARAGSWKWEESWGFEVIFSLKSSAVT